MPALKSPPPTRAFDGATYEPAKDHKRLKTLMDRVWRLMRDRKWRSLSEIAYQCQPASEGGCGARLRDFRKPKYGAHTVERERIASSEGEVVFIYRLIPNTKKKGGRK